MKDPPHKLYPRIIFTIYIFWKSWNVMVHHATQLYQKRSVVHLLHNSKTYIRYDTAFLIVKHRAASNQVTRFRAFSFTMHTKSLIAATFAILATAAPVPANDSKKPYIAVSLFFHIHPPNHFAFEEPAPTTVCR